MQHNQSLKACQFNTRKSIATQRDIKTAISKVDTSFTDAAGTVFRCKTREELRRALSVLWLCSFETLIKNNQRVSQISIQE